MPFSEAIPVPQRKRILILAKSLDENAIQKLSQDYLINGLTLVPASAAPDSKAALGLVDADGRPSPLSPGRSGCPAARRLTRLNPWVIAMLGALAVTMLLLVLIAGTQLRPVRRGEVLARHAATHDSLSGLPNRAALLEHLRRVIGRRRGDDDLAIACVELDTVKEVNDAYGRDVGDQLLRKVAQGFRSLAGKCYLVRVGGDEFAVVIDKPHAADRANELSERLTASSPSPSISAAASSPSMPASASPRSTPASRRRRRSGAATSPCTRPGWKAAIASACSTTRSTYGVAGASRSPATSGARWPSTR